MRRDDITRSVRRANAHMRRTFFTGTGQGSGGRCCLAGRRGDQGERSSLSPIPVENAGLTPGEPQNVYRRLNWTVYTSLRNDVRSSDLVSSSPLTTRIR